MHKKGKNEVPVSGTENGKIKDPASHVRAALIRHGAVSCDSCLIRFRSSPFRHTRAGVWLDFGGFAGMYAMAIFDLALPIMGIRQTNMMRVDGVRLPLLGGTREDDAFANSRARRHYL